MQKDTLKQIDKGHTQILNLRLSSLNNIIIPNVNYIFQKLKGTDEFGYEFVQRGCADDLSGNECIAGDYVSNYGQRHISKKSKATEGRQLDIFNFRKYTGI